MPNRYPVQQPPWLVWLALVEKGGPGVHPWARYNLATMLYRGHGEEATGRDLDGAFHHFQAAADAGVHQALFNVANMFARHEAPVPTSMPDDSDVYDDDDDGGDGGGGGGGDTREAEQQRGRPDGETRFSDATPGLIVDASDPDAVAAAYEATAVAWYHEAADIGDPMAHLVLGSRYCAGRGVEQCWDLGFDHHLTAVELTDSRHPRALYNLATHYFLGKGTEQDFEQLVMV